MNKQSKVFRLRFIEKVLGSVPPDLETFKNTMLAKGGTEDELTTLPQAEGEEAKRKTVFHRLDGRPMLYDYVVKGFLKSAFAFMQENGQVNKIPAYKSRIDNFVFISPRHIFFKGKKNVDGELSRGLRAMVAQGPRITFVTSEYISEGAEIEFRVDVYKNKYITMDMVEKAFEYGRLHGLGRWNSGGWGRFEVVKEQV